MTELTLSVNGQRWHARIHGEGEPILLLHGFTGDSTTWDRVCADLRDSYQLIAPDILGHGKSAKPGDAERYQMRAVADDVIAMLDQLGVERAHLLGYSMGGRLALHLALRHATRFSSLVLESASPGIEDKRERDERRRRDESLARGIEDGGIDAFVEYWESLPLWESQRDLSPGITRAQREGRLRNDATGLANSLRGMGAGAQPSVWRDLSEVKLPTLLLAGEYDHKFRAIKESMQRQMTNASLHVIPGAGHNAHLEQPTRFVNGVVSFLQGV